MAYFHFFLKPNEAISDKCSWQSRGQLLIIQGGSLFSLENCFHHTATAAIVLLLQQILHIKSQQILHIESQPILHISRVKKSYISRQAFHNKQHLYLSLTVPKIHAGSNKCAMDWLMILKANVKRPWMGVSGRQIGFLMPPFCRSGQALPNHTWPMTPVWDWEVFALLMMVPVRRERQKTNL